VEPILLFVSGWWWIAPAAAGAGVATYAGITARPRRARRLELDAARHDERLAYRDLVVAKARVRTAHADLLTSKSRRSAAPPTAQARLELQSARQDERAASMALRASRSRVKAGYTQYRAARSGDPLPIDRLAAVHDAINARWLGYETDIDKALAFPQLSDPRHPATAAFLHAQRDALVKRPLLRERATPEQYSEYRAAVRTLELTLLEAERQAGVHGRTGATPGTSGPAIGPGIEAATAALGELADRLPQLISIVRSARGGGSSSARGA
jgi:hypothetical protein